MSDELKNIIDSLKKQGEMCFSKAATDEQISAFEKENGILFPKQYREWLQFSDGGECFLPAGIQLFGIAHKPLIDVDEDDRPDENYIVIGELSSGDPIVFKKMEEEVSIYNHEAERIEDDERYADFFSFLRDLPAIVGTEDD